MERLQLLKIIGLVVGCLAKFVTGSLFVFSVYQDDIKLTFNYTQKEGKIHAIMVNLSINMYVTLPCVIYFMVY